MLGEEQRVGEEKRRNKINLNPISRLSENRQSSVEPYVRKGQVVADLGCSTGYYTFALAECVGPDGKVYAVDLNEKAIRELKEVAAGLGYSNVEVHVSSASDLDFIEDESVDFVLANGLLCNMPDHRQLAVNEMKRILKPTGRAFLSLGAYSPIGSFVDRAEWERILSQFRVERRGGFIQKWAAVSKKDSNEPTPREHMETSKRYRLLKLRKKLGE